MRLVDSSTALKSPAELLWYNHKSEGDHRNQGPVSAIKFFNYLLSGRMNKLTRKVLLVFAAGAAGGLANSLVVWFFGLLGITGTLGVSIAPALTPQWLYPRIVWGGIWGVLFLLPLYEERPVSRGFILSLGPTLVQLFIVFPLKAGKGVMGLDLGLLTPLFVLFFNFVWGVKTAVLLRIAGEG